MRAFSLIEIMMVVAVTAVLSAVAISTFSAVARKNDNRQELERLLGDVARERAAHVSAGRPELLLLCVDCVDEAGNANSAPRKDTLDFYLGEDPADRGHGRLLASTKYTLELAAGCQGLIALDALGRSIDLGSGNGLPDGSDATYGPLRPLSCPLDITVDDGDPEELVFGADGRLLPTFADALIAEPPHAQNLSSRTTPVPMARGLFSGDATRAPALPLY